MHLHIDEHIYSAAQKAVLHQHRILSVTHTLTYQGAGAYVNNEEKMKGRTHHFLWHSQGHPQRDATRDCPKQLRGLLLNFFCD